MPHSIAYLESLLPRRVKSFLADAKANNESVGDAGIALVDALKNRFQWTDDEACAISNALLECYGEDQRIFSIADRKAMFPQDRFVNASPTEPRFPRTGKPL